MTWFGLFIAVLLLAGTKTSGTIILHQKSLENTWTTVDLQSY